MVHKPLMAYRVIFNRVAIMMALDHCIHLTCFSLHRLRKAPYTEAEIKVHPLIILLLLGHYWSFDYASAFHLSKGMPTDQMLKFGSYNYDKAPKYHGIFFLFIKGCCF